MKMLQQVKDKLNTASSIDIASIINKIEKYDIVSFDIFDTLQLNTEAIDSRAKSSYISSFLKKLKKLAYGRSAEKDCKTLFWLLQDIL